MVPGFRGGVVSALEVVRLRSEVLNPKSSAFLLTGKEVVRVRVGAEVLGGFLGLEEFLGLLLAEGMLVVRVRGAEERGVSWRTLLGEVAVVPEELVTQLGLRVREVPEIAGVARLGEDPVLEGVELGAPGISGCLQLPGERAERVLAGWEVGVFLGEDGSEGCVLLSELSDSNPGAGEAEGVVVGFLGLEEASDVDCLGLRREVAIRGLAPLEIREGGLVEGRSDLYLVGPLLCGVVLEVLLQLRDRGREVGTRVGEAPVILEGSSSEPVRALFLCLEISPHGSAQEMFLGEPVFFLEALFGEARVLGLIRGGDLVVLQVVSE